MRFFSSTSKPKPSSAIYIRRPDAMPQGMNRTDLISLEQARTRPTVIYGGFVDRKTDVVVSNESPLDHLARWAAEQCIMEAEAGRLQVISPLRAADMGLSPFTAFMDSVDDFQDRDSASSCDSLALSTPELGNAPPVTLPGTTTAILIPLHEAMKRHDIRYRPELFELQ
ncbi:hypothetical protein BDW22DRAFT_1360069 [Trametopsis cervina]|nr:hypothetical protein BDW22DRAFT_1360069 [Trametopsis cervina]